MKKEQTYSYASPVKNKRRFGGPSICCRLRWQSEKIWFLSQLMSKIPSHMYTCCQNWVQIPKQEMRIIGLEENCSRRKLLKPWRSSHIDLSSIWTKPWQSHQFWQNFQTWLGIPPITWVNAEAEYLTTIFAALFPQSLKQVEGPPNRRLLWTREASE